MAKIILIDIALAIACYFIGVVCGRESMAREIIERGMTLVVEREELTDEEEDSDIPQIIHAGYTDAECGREK